MFFYVLFYRTSRSALALRSSSHILIHGLVNLFHILYGFIFETTYSVVRYKGHSKTFTGEHF